MQEACKRWGSPERAFPAVHIAGTNGKGSVSAMVEAMARASGLRTGLYTSPHLCSFTERVRLDGEPISRDALFPVLSEVLAKEPELSFFEVATLAAFVLFRDAKVDLAVVEVGLGGRLDATNVLPTPRAAAVTRIALDHTAILGDSLESIAREKAGIAKPGGVLFVGPVPSSVKEAIVEVAIPLGARVEDVASNIELPAFLPLRGSHQKDNARMAWTLAASLGIGVEHRHRGLADVRWPGRMEHVVHKGRSVLLDVAHNPDGARALRDHLLTLRLPSHAMALVFGVLEDKAWIEMLEILAPLCETRTFTTPMGRRAVPTEVLAARFPAETAPDPVTALEASLAELVVVCGSFGVVGPVRAHILGQPLDPIVGM